MEHVEEAYAALLAEAQAFSPAEYTVALLAGGTSAEREISLSSGAGAKAALVEAGFAVREFDPAVEADMAALEAAAAAGEVDVAFLCLHGKGGEDGTIQATLEDLGLPYTGSGVEASKKAIDKHATKCAYQKAGLPTAPWVKFDALVVERAQEAGVFDAMCEKALRDVLEVQKVVVKATEQGSTQGLYVVDAAPAADDAASANEEPAADAEAEPSASSSPSALSAEQAEKPITSEGIVALGDAINEALQFDGCVIVEKFIPGEEYTVAVVGNDNPVALPIIKIVPKSGFYDFEAKYAPGGSKHICPAPISPELTQTIMDYALSAHKCLGCRGMSRTDFMVDAEGDVWLLETNTIPGMTSTSLLPDAAGVAGLPFPSLCTLLVKLALE